jgi:murein DD-endopeptidase MepM/ murein hydrolase activator NlpD
LLVISGLQVAEAKKLYRYQDENGKWLFSDSPLKASESDQGKLVSVERLDVNRHNKKLYYLQNKTSDNTYQIKFINGYAGPVEVRLESNVFRNSTSRPRLPTSFVLEAGEKRHVATLWPMNKREDWSFSLRYSHTLGRPIKGNGITDLYHIPFLSSRGRFISQGFNGGRTHNDVHSRFAVDIALPIGTPILASREGVVVDLAEDFIRGGTDRKRFGEKANFVRILHDDETMATYAHLSLESVAIKPGQRVNVGQLIALSGNTGYSSGPHLHFAVTKNAGMEEVSIPFRFVDDSGGVVIPSEGIQLVNIGAR